MDDDEMIVIIVGDEREDDDHTLAIPNTSPTIKEEPADELEQSDELKYSELNPEFILETAEMHGEYIDLKKEEYDIEYLEDDILKKDVNPSEYEAVEKPKSYISQLRKNFPKMRKDENYLIAHLAEAMRNTKAPPPPSDFCEETEGIFVCRYCYAESITFPSACRHYQKKHGSRVFVCFACGANFKCTTGLYKHEKRCQAPGSNLMLKARGQYLGRKGRTRPYLTRNKFSPGPLSIKPKDGTKTRYDCSQCSASYKYKDALQAHTYLHSGIRPYQCEQCPMAYTSKVALRRHLMLHTDVEYICDTCKRSFKAKNTLVTHMNTHLPQRKYPCDQCGKRFAQKYAVRNHINRDHLNIPPPFACAACPKRFPRLTNLKAHMKARHGLTLMSRKSFIKALPSMNKEEQRQATVVFNQRNNNHPETKFNDSELTSIHLDTTSDLTKISGEVVEIVPVENNGHGIASPLEEIHEEPISEDQTQEVPISENQIQEEIQMIEEEIIKLDNDKKPKKKKRAKVPKLDLSFVTKRKKKIIIRPDGRIQNVHKDAPVIEDADLCNYTDIKGNIDNSEVNEGDKDSARRKRLQKWTHLKKARILMTGKMFIPRSEQTDKI